MIFYTLLRDRLPTWSYSGPWPFELGIAGMLLWLGEAFSRTPIQYRLFNGNTFVLFDWLRAYNVPFSFILSVIAGIIISGFVLRDCYPKLSKCIRICGLACSTFVFGLISFSFLSAFAWSMGGICYAFIAWRTAAVAAVHLREVVLRGRTPEPA